ncbi:hypothetical protein MSAN_02116500 [Mycena sanguinolenta]|uniref:Uncharacterized protein n=1 Tax=Mycena sanguinolenta TaxID=230812 RepID=A0A8H7CKG8_9AGAR|nr:hypothetical protein MSAN_02116500 [Mycena sanguinolenta]
MLNSKVLFALVALVSFASATPVRRSAAATATPVKRSAAATAIPVKRSAAATATPIKRSAAATATPIGRSADASPSVEVCTGSLSPANGCVTIPVVSDECVDLNGGLSFLNKEISNALVPDGFICTFFEDFGCIASGTGNSGSDSEVILQGGSWDFFEVPGLSGTEDFNDLTSSFTCSPL